MNAPLAGIFDAFPVDVQAGQGTKVRRNGLVRLVDLEFRGLPYKAAPDLSFLFPIQDIYGNIFYTTLDQFGAQTVGNKANRGRIGVADVDYFAATANAYVGYEGLTAPRTVTLPPALSYPAGQALYVADETGNCSPSVPITIVPSGSDILSGKSAADPYPFQMTSPYQKAVLHSNGSNLWTVA